MKYCFFLILMLSSYQLTFAQSETTTKTRSRTNINISFDGKNKLKLQADDDIFDLNYKFDRSKTQDLIDTFGNHFQEVPASWDLKDQRWSAVAEGYEINITKGQLRVFLERAKMSNKQGQQLMQATQDALDVFDININTDISWN